MEYNYELRITNYGSASRHCERSEAIQNTLCPSVSSPCPSVKQKHSYTEYHRVPQRTTESHKNSLVSQSLVSNSLVSQSLVSKSLVSQRLTQLLSYSVILLFCFLSLSATAQDSAPPAQGYVSYTYDASGNRTHRTINMPAYTPPPQDSTEMAVEDENTTIAALQDMENDDQTPQEAYNGEETYQEIYTDALSETLITIYPNPTKGLLTVKMSNMPQHSASSLTLFDIQGRVISQQQTLSDENKLDISAQPAGTYIMQIAVGEEQVSWKIVKQ